MRPLRSIDPSQDRNAVDVSVQASAIRINPKRGAIMNMHPPGNGPFGKAEPVPILQQYGALPWRVNRQGFLEVLLVTSRRRGRWTVPKGWLVKHCSGSQSAETEAYEEAGAIGRVNAAPIGSFRYSKQRDDGSAEPCNVTIFGLHVLGTLHNWPEMSERKRRWMSVSEACDVVGEPTLAAFLATLRSKSIDASGLAPETALPSTRQDAPGNLAAV